MRSRNRIQSPILSPASIAINSSSFKTRFSSMVRGAQRFSSKSLPLSTLALSLLFLFPHAQAQSDISGDTARIANAPTERRLADKLHDVPSVLDYGAVCNTNVLRWTNVQVAADSKVLNVVHGWFETRDAGKLIVVAGAGPNGTNLATRIASVQSKSQVTLESPAQSSVNKSSGYIAYGTDDAPAINAALTGKSDPKWDLGELRLPHGVCGVGSTIMLPADRGPSTFGLGEITLRGEGRGASWLVALAPMSAVIQEPTGDHSQANLSDFGIDGSGLSDFGANIQGGHGGHHSGMYYNDNLIAGLHVGTIPVNADGTLTNPKSWYTNVWEFMVDHSTITADIGSVMPHGAPRFGILNSAGDSHFSDVIVAHTSVAGVRDTGTAHNFYSNVHAWGSPRYEYWIRGHDQFANCEVDGAAEAGVRVDIDGLVWTGGGMISMNKGHPVGFYFPSSSSHNSIIGPTIQDIPSTDYLKLAPGARLSDSILQIPGLPNSSLSH